MCIYMNYIHAYLYTYIYIYIYLCITYMRTQIIALHCTRIHQNWNNKCEYKEENISLSLTWQVYIVKNGHRSVSGTQVGASETDRWLSLTIYTCQIDSSCMDIFIYKYIYRILMHLYKCQWRIHKFISYV
jgi:hypothetical protein